jgi:hypothetical protein
VATTANSTSTMHKLASTPITKDCFEMDDYDDTVSTNKNNICCDSAVIIQWMEDLRQKYNETKDIRYWKELIRWLPESWLQTRTFTCNYSVLRNIYHWRKNHKLTEWHSFCGLIETLPYASKLLIFDN